MLCLHLLLRNPTVNRVSLYKILLGVSLRGVLGLGLAAEGEVWPVFLFDAFHFLVPIRFFFPVEESGRYRKARQHHEDHHGDDAWGTKKSQDFNFNRE